MSSKITYHQQVSYCGKPQCRKCREGTGHGPYWYSYQTVEGRTIRTYIGKKLPPDAQAELDGVRAAASPQERELSDAVIRIYALGQFRLERRVGHHDDWQTVTDASWQHQRVRALLACLISSPARRLGREQIMEALWPDLDFETASNRLDRSVYSLRQLFEPGRSRLATSQLLRTEREMIVLAEHPLIWIDADAFDRLLSEAHRTADPGKQEELLSKVSLLYSGHFLPEEKKLEWTLLRRDSLQRNWVGTLLDLADHRAAREDYLNAIEPLDRLLSVDPTNEAGVQRLISLLAQLGRRGEALRAYKRLAVVLQQEYHIAPLPETRALYEAVRRGVGKVQRSALPDPQSPAQAANAATTRQDASPVVQIGRVHQGPLVGRESEVELLQSLIATTENTARFKLAVQKRMFAAVLDPQRRPQSVLLLGEVGIGKTRLAEEASRDAKKRGWAVAWSRVYAQEGNIPYRLWTEVLRMATNQGVWQRQELTNRPLVFQPLNALLPELKVPPVSFSASLSPEQEQLRLWEAVYELLAIISTNTPLLIALDDLQWADGSSCELLGYLVRRLHGHPIVIVGTCRENELVKDHALRSLLTDLQRERVLQTISLLPLSDEQIDKIVANVPNVPQPVAHDIRTRAAGNPFFAEELARIFGPQPELPGVVAQTDSLPVVLPDTINAVLALRLNQLSQPCQQLLRKASVLGRAFEFQLINAMEANTPGLSEDLVLELLEEGLQSGMLTEEGTGTRITYHFWHPLLVSHLYEGLSATRRAHLHRRAASLFIQRYQGREAEGADTITHHLVQGGADPQQIVHYAELAGDHAYGLSSYPEAEQHYRTTLEYLGTPTPMLTPEGQLPPEQLRKAELLELLGDCMRIQGKHINARQAYEQSLELRSLQRLSKNVPEYQHEVQIRALLWCAIGWTWYDVSDNAKALQCYGRAENSLEEAHSSAHIAWANIRLQQSYVSWREGKYDKALAVAKEALTLFEGIIEQQEKTNTRENCKTRIERMLAGDPINVGRTYNLLGIILGSGSRSSDALNYFNSALTIYEQYETQWEIAVVCCNLGDIYLKKADYSLAQSVLRRSLHLAEGIIGELPLAAFALGNLGVLDLRTGNLTEAESEFKQVIAQVKGISDPDPADISIWYAYSATALIEQGMTQDALQSLRYALSAGHTAHVPPYIGIALVALGHLRIRQSLQTSLAEHTADFQSASRLYLSKAKKSLMHALSLGEIEAETKIEAQVALSHAMLLLGELAEAQQLITQTLREAQKLEFTWLVACSQHVLACILAAQNLPEQAMQHFDAALKTFRKTGMRLELARTLQQYGTMLIQQGNTDEKRYQRGRKYLDEARELFTACGASLDLQLLEQVVASEAVV